MNRNAIRSALGSPRAIVGGIVLGLIILGGLIAPWLSPYGPADQSLLTRLQPPAWSAAGTMEHMLGTDHLGRDLLTRILYGARVSLSVSLSAVALSALVGVLFGLLAGFLGGRIDFLIMRLVDFQLSFPVLLLAIILAAVLRPSGATVVLVLVISGWATYARVVRAQVLSLREREYVLAARSLGGSTRRLLLRHVLPNIQNVIVVLATVQMAQFIIAESTLSFLGLGILPPTPSWGGMINEGRDYVWSAWWIQTLPGVVIVLCVSAIGLLGDWLRDFLDPYGNGR